MTDAGQAAYEQWKANYGPPMPAPASGVLPKLPGRQHDAIVAAARRPDHLLPGISSGAPESFNQRTLAAVHADMRPSTYAAPQQLARPERPVRRWPGLGSRRDSVCR
jgi:hypothetical protein